MASLDDVYSILIPPLGIYIINDGAAHTSLSYKAIIVREDTVVSVCTGFAKDGVTVVDFKAKYNWVNLKSTDNLLKGEDGETITAITLTSGSISCVKK